MDTRDELKRRIRVAFADVPYPGDDRLRGSDEGAEPYRLEDEFRGRDDWQDIDARFLDDAPSGLGSALSFFSHEALRFYLPAYLLADIDGKLMRSDPVFYLTHGLEPSSADVPINPRRYGGRAWSEYARERFAAFTPAQAAAVASYLELRLADAEIEYERSSIEAALDGYWRSRATGDRS
jgi:hypothetical protein